MTDSDHPMVTWAKAQKKTITDLAIAAGCSRTHLLNIFAGRREASLGLALKLSEISGGTVPPSAFEKTDNGAEPVA